MSSDAADAVTGEGDARRRPAPKLRFPEFRDTGEWSSSPLRLLVEPVTEKVRSAELTPVSITAGQGFVSQTSKFGRDIAGDQYKNYTYLRKGDFAYNKGNSKRFPQGYACRLHEFHEAAASSAFICFRLRDGNDPRFLLSYFDQNAHGRQLARFITSGARSDGLLNIRPEEFYSVEFPVPPIEAEQHKIGSCLSSLDQLISAEGERLAALKHHKRGLMQALFPAEGQTTPRLRFPEFRDTGEWQQQPLNSLCVVLNNRRQPVSSADRKAGGYPYYGASGIVDHINDYIFDERLLLVGEDGAKWGAFEPTAFLVEGRYWVNNHAHVLRPTGVNDRFLEQYLVKADLATFVSGAAPPKLTLGKLKTIQIPLPPLRDEQDRIADCLFSLGESIVRQATRVEALKSHKSGLMQQLFPSPAKSDS